MFTVCRAARAAVNDNVFFFHHRTMPKKELFPHKLRSGCKKVQQKTVFHGIIHLPSPNEIMRISILNTRLSPSDVAFCPAKNDAPSLIHPLIRPLSMPVPSVTATNIFFLQFYRHHASILFEMRTKESVKIVKRTCRKCKCGK